MAKTVDQFSTIENFRTKYNELAVDVGDSAGLRTSDSSTIVDAVNSIEDKSFFFQEYVYIASAAQNQFTGNDSFGHSLKFRANRIQVFKNSVHLNESFDYSISGPVDAEHTIISLTAAASAGDKITIYSFTGSYLGTAANSDQPVGQFAETAVNTIYNTNDNGVILNGDGTPHQTSVLETGYNIQLAGKTFAEDDILLTTGKTLTAPRITDGTALITNAVGTAFTSFTSTEFYGNLTGTTADLTGTVTANNFTIGSASINETDLEKIDDLTNGTVIASKAVAVDTNKDITGFRNVTLTGELDAASLDVSGNSDIAGNSEVHGTTGSDGDFRVGNSGGDKFNVAAITGNTQIDGTLEVDGTTGIDGDLRVGSDKFNVTASSGNTQIDGQLEVDGTAGVDGNFRVGSAAANKFNVIASSGDTQIDGTLNVDSHTDLNSSVTVDGVAEFNSTVGVDGNFRVGSSNSSKFDIAAASGNTQIDGTLNVDGVVTGGGFTIGSAVIGEAELEILDGATLSTTEINYLDGTTLGTVVASKVVGADSNKDITGFRNVTLSGELDAGSLDVSGNIDVDGIANFDVVDIDGAVHMQTTLTVVGGVDLQSLETNALSINSVTVSSTAAELNYNDGITLGTALAGKVLSSDSNLDTTGIRHLTTSGNAVIGGNLTVSGTTTTVNSDTITLADNIIRLNSDFTSGTPSEDTGFEVLRGSSPTKSFIWDESEDKWSVGSESLVAGTFIGNLTGNTSGTSGSTTGNAATATTLATARTIAGQSFNGSANISIGANNLSDINYTTTPSAGQALIWDNSAGYWEPTTLDSTTDSYAEGANNMYFTDDRVNDIIVSGAGLTKSYNTNPDGGADSPIDGRTTLNIGEGAGIAVAADLVSLDYETVSSAPSSVSGTDTGHLWFVI